MTYVPMEQNYRVYLLSKLTNTKRSGHNQTIIQETLVAPSIEAEKTNTLEVTPTTIWMASIMQYLLSDELLSDELEAKKI